MAQTKKQKAVVRRWVKNLESGLYKQGRERLVKAGKDFDRFCCLGVLCDMAVRAKVIPAPTRPRVGDAYCYKNNTQVLSPAVMRWAGLKDDTGGHDTDSLAARNDDGLHFKTIAKIIRSKPKGLFV